MQNLKISTHVLANLSHLLLICILHGTSNDYGSNFEKETDITNKKKLLLLEADLIELVKA